MDTNVILAALASSSGFSFRLLTLMVEGKVPYLLSLKLLTEYWSVMTRHENLRKIPLSLSEIESLAALLVQKATHQEVYYRWRPNLPDESDNFILELAMAGNAKSIVTFNKKDFEEGELKCDIMIETPKEYLLRRRVL